MYESIFATYQRLWKLGRDSSEVIAHRTELMRNMSQNPTAAMNPANWLEMQQMVAEKMVAFSQAGLALWLGASAHKPGQVPTMQQLLALHKNVLRPVSSTAASNAKRTRTRKRR